MGGVHGKESDSRNGYYKGLSTVKEHDESNHTDCFGLISFLPWMQSKNKQDFIGTPLPDSPRMIRKMRMKEAQLGNYTFLDLEESEDESGSTSKIHNRYHQHNGNGFETHRNVNDPMNFSSDCNLIHEGHNADSILHQKYQITELLGVGSTSTCHRCINRSTKEVYACKIIDKESVEKKFAGMSAQLYTEILALRRLKHPNIITLFDVFVTSDKIYIVMELLSGGELFDYVVEKGTLTEEEASGVVRKVISAVVYMHQNDIIHRDLKPENLLLVRRPRSPLDSVDVKIIDFGLSKCLVEPVASSFLGTRGYLAPEMLQRRNYSKAVDVWSLGVIIFVLLCGCLPFDDELSSIPTDDIVIQKFSLRFPRWSRNLSPAAKDLLSHLLDIDPISRYTAVQALAHPWVSGVGIPKDNFLQSPGRLTLPSSNFETKQNETPPSNLEDDDKVHTTSSTVPHLSISTHGRYHHVRNTAPTRHSRKLVRQTSI